MKYLLTLILILLSANVSLGQTAAVAQALANKQAAVVPVQLNRLVKLHTPDSEVGDAIVFLEDLEKSTSYPTYNDRDYIRFFTTYSIPEKLRNKAVLTLSFIIHSMVGATVNEKQLSGGYYPLAIQEKNEKGEIKFIPFRQVKGSDTLWWIDLRDYNWTEQAWENMFALEGYFAEPVVTHEKNGALRLIGGSNAVVRADWFMYNALNLTAQADADKKTRIYREFLYGATGKQPKTVAEFEQIWATDTAKARERGNVHSTIVTQSDVVSRHNRILFGYRTELGYYYRTYDVKNLVEDRDYAEAFLDFKGNPPGKGQYDAGELIATNQCMMQVYDLGDANDNLIDFGDPTVVRHTGDILGDVRVRTAHSCIDCHAAGPIPSENTIKEYIKQRASAEVYDKYDALRIHRNYLSDKFEDSVKENQLLFANALKKINGLTPDENAKNYLEIITWYGGRLDLNQAAFECGMTAETFKAKLSDDNKFPRNRLPMRLVMLLDGIEKIPREAWETPGNGRRPGVFQQSMIALYGLTAIEYVPTVFYETLQPGNVMAGNNIVYPFKAGEKFESSGVESNGWIGVKTKNGLGYIQKNQIKVK